MFGYLVERYTGDVFAFDGFECMQIFLKMPCNSFSFAIGICCDVDGIRFFCCCDDGVQMFFMLGDKLEALFKIIIDIDGFFLRQIIYMTKAGEHNIVLA